jgi:hypothetical protein
MDNNERKILNNIFGPIRIRIDSPNDSSCTKQSITP